MRDVSNDPTIESMGSVNGKNPSPPKNRKKHNFAKVHEPKRSSEDVYREWLEKAGEKACVDAVINYWHATVIAEILLQHTNADDLDEFLRDNLTEPDPFRDTPRTAAKNQ